jgi:hypothetical protein
MDHLHLFVLTLSPLGPFSPGSPRSPLLPGTPLSPGDPGIPAIPGSPFGPGLPGLPRVASKSLPKIDPCILYQFREHINYEQHRATETYGYSSHIRLSKRLYVQRDRKK